MIDIVTAYTVAIIDLLCRSGSSQISGPEGIGLFDCDGGLGAAERSQLLSGTATESTSARHFQLRRGDESHFGQAEAVGGLAE